MNDKMLAGMVRKTLDFVSSRSGAKIHQLTLTFPSTPQEVHIRLWFQLKLMAMTDSEFNCSSTGSVQRHLCHILPHQQRASCHFTSQRHHQSLQREVILLQAKSIADSFFTQGT